MTKNINKGFTLVELLVVIAIMGILTVITVSQFSSSKMKARDIQRKADLNSVSKALQMYYADYGYFPPDSTGINWGGDFVDNGYAYMKVVPKENTVTKPQYCYVVDPAVNKPDKFALFSTLENDQDPEYVAIKYPGRSSYKHCGGHDYFYAISSPNSTPLDFTGIKP